MDARRDAPQSSLVNNIRRYSFQGMVQVHTVKNVTVFAKIGAILVEAVSVRRILRVGIPAQVMNIALVPLAQFFDQQLAAIFVLPMVWEWCDATRKQSFIFVLTTTWRTLETLL